MRKFSLGGVKLPENKITARAGITPIAMPAELALTLGQHIGAPARAVVGKGDRVKRGDLIAEAAGTVSAPLHSPVDGTVTRLDRVTTPQGVPAEAIFIAPDEGTPSPAIIPAATQAPLPPAAAIVEAVGSAGIVGMGGAAFPTAVKLAPPPGAAIDTVIVNCAECEPYLTCDHALMTTDPAGIVDGTRLVMEATGARRGVLAIEANKPDAAALLRQAAAAFPEVEVVELLPRYPQGGEKQLIEAVTGRRVADGAIPASEGVVVQNVATVRAVSDAVRNHAPLTARVVTVTGPSLSRPGNFLAPLGTPLKALVEAAGGLPADTGKIVIGGPMMGRAASTLDSFTVKGMSGLLVLPADASRRRPEEPCIRCGRCITVCPMGLEPYLLAKYAARGMTDEGLRAGNDTCIECGSCSYICPSARPLLDYIRLGRRRAADLRRLRNSTEKK